MMIKLRKWMLGFHTNYLRRLKVGLQELHKLRLRLLVSCFKASKTFFSSSIAHVEGSSMIPVQYAEHKILKGLQTPLHSLM